MMVEKPVFGDGDDPRWRYSPMVATLDTTPRQGMCVAAHLPYHYCARECVASLTKHTVRRRLQLCAAASLHSGPPTIHLCRVVSLYGAEHADLASGALCIASLLRAHPGG